MTAVPALPDSERRTRATISASVGPITVDFAIFGNGTDYADWLEVWDDGVKLTAVTDWTLDSPSGSLATLERPITDARVTLVTARTGDIDIVGTDKPQRLAQLTESQGVPARAINQLYTHVIARLREFWDQRVFRAPPGETIPMTLPAAATRASKMFVWDSDGNPSVADQPTGSAVLSNNGVTNAFLRDSTACSVIGRAANSTGDPADIQAAANSTLLWRTANALVFSTLTAILDAIMGSTRGMILVRGAAVWSALAVGAANRILTSDGTDAAWVAPVAQLPRGYIDGCALTNGTDATNDINIAAGVCRDSTNAFSITVAAMAGKQLDANWAPGAAAGMRNSAAAITNTTYHIYAVAKADGTQDIYAHTSTTAATALAALQAEPSGASYVYARLIMSIVRTGASIKAFKQKLNGVVLWVAAVSETVGTAFDTTQRNYVLTVPTGIDGLSVDCTVAAYQTGGTPALVTGHPDVTLTTPVVATPLTTPIDVQGNTASVSLASRTLRTVDSSAQLAVKASGTVTGGQIFTFGFIHPRGQDA